jgi:hypothetical protein
MPRGSFQVLPRRLGFGLKVLNSYLAIMRPAICDHRWKNFENQKIKIYEYLLSSHEVSSSTI